MFRAFAILGLFSERRSEIGVAMVSTELGLNAVTAHRFVKTLERIGALVPTARGRYRLGYLMADIGERAMRPTELARMVQPILDHLVEELHEGAMATVFESDWVVVIARAAADRYLSMDVRVGQRLEAYCTAHGKLWLADLAPAALDRYLDVVTRTRSNRATITGRAELLAEVTKVRRQGFSTNRDESEPSIRAVAVPVLSGTGRMVTALSVFGPASRVTDEVMALAHRHLQDAAGEARRALYGNAPVAPVRRAGALEEREEPAC